MKQLLVIFLLTVSGCSISAKPSFEFDSRRPIAAAHRAEHSSSSENSVDAIKSAQINNIQLIEIDIRESLDGDLFLFHNKKLDPGTIDGPTEFLGREFKSLSSAEISKVVLPKGETIPRFESAIDALNLSSSFILDIKGGAETHKKVIRAIKERGPKKNYWMLCYDLECAKEAKVSGIEGMEVLFRLNREMTLSQALGANPKIVQIDCEESCLSEVVKIKNANKAVLVLATSLKPELDNKMNWQRVLNDGIDIILTDRPLELKLLQTNLERQNQ